MCPAMALFGPWPDLSMHWRGFTHVIALSLAAESAVGQRSNRHHHPQHQEWVVFAHQVLIMAIAM
jgi:hypothetical protein